LFYTRERLLQTDSLFSGESQGNVQVMSLAGGKETLSILELCFKDTLGLKCSDLCLADAEFYSQLRGCVVVSRGPASS